MPAPKTLLLIEQRDDEPQVMPAIIAGSVIRFALMSSASDPAPKYYRMELRGDGLVMHETTRTEEHDTCRECRTPYRHAQWPGSRKCDYCGATEHGR